MLRIINANRGKVGELASGLPDLSPAVSLILQDTKIGFVNKQNINGYVQEITNWFDVRVAIQPFTAEQLIIRPEGERSWRWYMMHSLPELVLQTDDRIIIRGISYRVMERINAIEYGFLEYHIIEDYRTTTEITNAVG